MLVVAVLLLVASIVGALLWFNLQYGGGDVVPTTTGLPGADPAVDAAAGSATGAQATDTTAAPVVAPVVAGPATITTITTFDPDGDGEENAANTDLSRADGNPATAWTTECYSSQYMGAKRGVGLVVSFDTAMQQALAVDVINAPVPVAVLRLRRSRRPDRSRGVGARTRYEGVRLRTRDRHVSDSDGAGDAHVGAAERARPGRQLLRRPPVSRPTRRDHAGRLNRFVTLRCIPALDDTQLVTAAQSGDRGALDQLLRRHYDRVHSVCRRITGSASDADDACQEALIKIVRNLPRFDGRSSFGTWAYRIATNASLDELRKRQRRPSLQIVDDRSGELIDHAATGRTDRVDDQLAIDTALDGLSEDFRVVVVLRDVIDLDYQEISEILDIPLGTVKSRIARARAQLAESLRLDHLPPLDADVQETTSLEPGTQQDEHAAAVRTFARTREPRRRPGASKSTE